MELNSPTPDDVEVIFNGVSYPVTNGRFEVADDSPDLETLLTAYGEHTEPLSDTGAAPGPDEPAPVTESQEEGQPEPSESTSAGAEGGQGTEPEPTPPNNEGDQGSEVDDLADADPKYGQNTIAQLIDLLLVRGLAVPSGARKGDLVDLLEADDDAKVRAAEQEQEAAAAGGVADTTVPPAQDPTV